MLIFLLVISFIIHFILLFSIIILYRKQSAKDEKITVELQMILDSYMEEIRRENDKLQNLIEQSEDKTEHEHKIEYPSTPVYNPPMIPSEEKTEDQVETSLTAKILSLAEKGFAAEEIAKKLQCGKTEAELILKFHRK